MSTVVVVTLTKFSLFHIHLMDILVHVKKKDMGQLRNVSSLFFLLKF